MRTPEERLTWLREMIADEASEDAEVVTANCSPVHDLGLDSLDLVELVIAVEEQYGFDFPDDKDLTSLATVAQWHAYIERLITEAGGQAYVDAQVAKRPPTTHKKGWSSK